MGLQKYALCILHLFLTLVVTGSFIYAVAFGFNPLPPLAEALNPGTGIWTSVQEAAPLQSQVLHFQSLQQPVTIVFESNGTPHIQASTDHDLFWTMGYLQARYRLVQMDLMRRQGEGKLAAILGSSALSTDQFQVTLGLDRIAKAEWQAMPVNSEVHQILQVFSDGVNADINESKRNGSLPFMFKLLNYQPVSWTPLDTLVIQGDMIQSLDFSTSSLEYAQFTNAFGYDRTLQWLPVLPPDVQHPYDISSSHPYHVPVPLPSQLVSTALTSRSIDTLTADLSDLPLVHIPDGSSMAASNAWAVNGLKAANGKAILAGDPHLNLTLPSIWYQVDATAPDYTFSGATIPGIPLPLLGHNQHISWSVTNVQNQSTLFYVEKTSPDHPSEYYWNGAWRPMQHLLYTIAVKGESAVQQKVALTVHGPILIGQIPQSVPGTTISVDWMGAFPSTDFEALINLVHSTNFAQFHQALSQWTAPTLNFVYADDQRNIGAIASGSYPIVKSGVPWLPLPGTGEADISGNIPYTLVPYVYNPPDHIIVSANQRPVGNSYPYYIGTTWSDYDNGYRANEIYSELSSQQSLTTQDMERIQNGTHDYLASLIIPKLLNALPQGSQTADTQNAAALLGRWNDTMDMNSPAASIWWTFWNRYLTDTFQPWWNTYHVPYKTFPGLAVTTDQAPLVMDLETWTLHDQNNPAFTSPGQSPRSAQQVMRQAFTESIDQLKKTLGSNPQTWTWGKLHSLTIPSLLQVDALAYGPIPAVGDTWTINAAGSIAHDSTTPVQNTASHGPSWRFIVNWGSGDVEGVYPGGQDENPASIWYESQLSSWIHGQYYPFLTEGEVRHTKSAITLILQNR